MVPYHTIPLMCFRSAWRKKCDPLSFILVPYVEMRPRVEVKKVVVAPDNDHRTAWYVSSTKTVICVSLSLLSP